MADQTRTVKVKFDGDAKGLAAASREGEREVDRFNKSVDKKFRKSGDDSGKSFNQSLKKWFSPSSLGKAGQEGGTVFGSGFLGALKTPVLGPALAGLLVGAAAVAAPAAGAVAASGLVLAFGAGLAGLGLVFAAKSDAVKKKWEQTTSAMGRDMQLFAKPYEATLTHAADVADKVFGRFAPSLEASFKETAPVVSAFVDDVGAGLEELQPAVRPLSEAFQAVLQSLGPAFQSAMASASDGLIKLSESVKKNPDGLADLVDGVGQLTDKALGGISALNDFNGKIEDLTGGTSAVDLIFGKANSKIGEFVGTVKNALDPLSSLKGAVDALLGSANKTTGAVGLTGDAVKYYTQGLDENQVKALLASKAADGTRSAFDRQKAAADAVAATIQRQSSATDALISSMNRLSNLQLALSGSQIGYQAALDAGTASLKENGRTLDISTEKGRNNQTALNNLASAANAQTDAMLKSNKGTAAAAASAESSRANFVRLAQQMGATKPQAEAMAKSMIDIPNVNRTARLQANITDLESKLKTAKGKLADKKLTATQRATLEAYIKNLEDGIAKAKRDLASVPSSKTVTITTKYTTVGSRSSGSGVGGGHEVTGKGNAAGGLIQPRTRRWVGERGPEILEMGNEGGRILSAEQIGAALAGGGSQPMTAEIHIEIGGEVVRVVRTEIKANDRNTTRRRTAGVRV